MAQDFELLLQQLRTAISNPPQDARLRKELHNASRDLQLAVEDKYDTMYRILYSSMHITIARVASDLQIFQTLTNASDTMTTKQLANASHANEILIGRILRFLSSHGMIKETEADTFASNNITEVLSIPGFQAGMRHFFEALLPCLQELPKFLLDTGYENPADVLHSPFQLAHKTDQPAFIWALSQPKLLHDFQLWMATFHNEAKMFLDVIDFQSMIGPTSAETVVFVDVGGGLGQQCVLLKQSLPGLAGRVILQDSPPVLEQAATPPEIEKMVHDFWTDQPVKEAKVYYLRNILHDYPDEKALLILKKTSEALGKDSVIFIDEQIIPDCGSHWRATELDIVMMSSLASIERTETQWRTLLDEAGLEARSIQEFDSKTGQSILVAIPKQT